MSEPTKAERVACVLHGERPAQEDERGCARCGKVLCVACEDEGTCAYCKACTVLMDEEAEASNRYYKEEMAREEYARERKERLKRHDEDGRPYWYVD